MAVFTEKNPLKPEDFYAMADTLLHNPSDSSEQGLFNLIRELQQLDPDRYINILVQKITTAGLPKDQTAKFLKIVRES